MAERTRAPPSPHPHKIRHLGRGKGRPAARPLGFGGRQASARGCEHPQSSPGAGSNTAPAALSGLGGQETAQGSLCCGLGSLGGRFEQRGGGRRVRAAEAAAPRSSPAAGTRSLPGSVRLGDTRVLCVPGRALSWSISYPSAEGKQSIKRKIVCVRVSATS